MNILFSIYLALLIGHTDQYQILSNSAGQSVVCETAANDRIRSVVFLLAFNDCLNQARDAGFRITSR